MKAFLMHRNRDFDVNQPLPPQEAALHQDLGLDMLIDAMADGDPFLREAVQRALLLSLGDVDSILYRQAILRDCLNYPTIIRDLYHIPIEAIENKKKFWMSTLGRYPTTILMGAVQMMEMFMMLLVKLRKIADQQAARFESEGFRTFFEMIHRELDDDYFEVVKNHLKELKFTDGVLMSAELGRGNEGVNYVLRKPVRANGWLQQLLAPKAQSYAYYIADRDENGARTLGELKDRGLNQVANVLAQSAEHIDSFLQMLRVELAFYIGCLNLHERLVTLGAPTCFPEPAPPHERRHNFTNLYDICLLLTTEGTVVGNDGALSGVDLVMISGANQGGKSTFLRSIGLAQLMMQCGMFAPAQRFSANLCTGLFTHYRRREDATMKSGKLDEELSRMSEIVDQLSPNALVLLNESFAATNEREGSEIARQIVQALVEKHIKVVFVTHLYELTRTLHAQQMHNIRFLQAERLADGQRTFKIVEGSPSQTSHGIDLYREIFGDSGA